MKTIQIKTLFIALLLSIAVPSLPAEMDQAQKDLFQAVQKGDVAGVEKALVSGADINEKNERAETALTSHTALMSAAWKGHLEVVKLLLERNADVNIQDKLGRTALISAAWKNYLEVVELLLERNSDVNIQTVSGQTALIIAAWRNYLEVAKLLLERNSDVNIQDKSGQTALIIAANEGHLEMVKFLLKNGADIGLENHDGETALKLAEKSGNTQIVKIMMAFVIEKMAITEEQRQKLAKEQDGIDLISADDITKEPLDKLMILGKLLFLRKTIMDYMISKVGSEEGILDPFTRIPISAEIQLALLGYFSLPINLLKSGGPIYRDSADLQQRENWIVMTGEPETEKEREELKELEDDAAEFRKRIRDTLERYNYSSTE